jgi:hypothetical protein
MSNPAAVSPATEAPALSAVEGAVEAYLATWNETDAARRQAAVARAWEQAGRYRDPLMASEACPERSRRGHAGIDAMPALSAAEGLAGVQARFPGRSLP